MSAARDEFYVGYRPQAPSGLWRWLRPRVAALLAAAAALAAGLALAQRPFARATFEYGVVTTAEGTLRAGPAPYLEVARPGRDEVGPSTWLLVGQGKHGAAAAVRGLDGRRVEARGSLIHRDGVTMLELAPGGVRELAPGTGGVELTAGRPVTLRGEIVDSKCFLGVMKPGNLKPHRACAVRCISGGVPPVLLVRDARGDARYYLLVGPDGGPVNAAVLPYVAEPVELSGELRGYYPGPPVLAIDPADIRRLP